MLDEQVRQDEEQKQKDILDEEAYELQSSVIK